MNSEAFYRQIFKRLLNQFFLIVGFLPAPVEPLSLLLPLLLVFLLAFGFVVLLFGLDELLLVFAFIL